MTDLTGRVAIITGASRGIGFGLAQALLHGGCRVCICSKDLNGITAAAHRLNAGPDQVLSFAVDVSNEHDHHVPNADESGYNRKKAVRVTALQRAIT